MKMNKGVIAGLVLGVVGLVTTIVSYDLMMGYNEAGQRHFVQTFFGDQKTVTEGGPFWYGNGTKEPYMNSIRTIKTPEGRACDYEQKDGFIVQFGDGGKGSICAQLDSVLPFGDTFVNLHNKYRSEAGVRAKLLDPNFRALFTTTAELFTSTEAYETKRSQIAAALQDQLKNGAYVTTTEARKIVVGINKDGTTATQTKDFSVIKYSSYDKDGNPTGSPLYQENPFAEWDMNDIQVTVTGYDFEPKTMAQIQDRRDAANRGETAQANAKAAYWEGEQAKADGETKRIKAQALAEIKNAPAIADAKRDAELAVIEATKLKDKATELEAAAVARTGQATQDALAAIEEAKAIKILAEAEAYKLDKMQAAGQLFKQIEADVQKNKDIALAIGQMKVPATMIVGSGNTGDGSTEMQKLLQLQVLKSVKDMDK